MSSCHDLFQEFQKKISVSSSKKESLRTSRDALRDKIRKHFKDVLKVKGPDFHGQGSYMMKTLVNPLDGEYDIDDGVYLNNIEDDNIPTPETVHKWILEAVKDQTNEISDGPRAVRVIYAKNYHVDLPVYHWTGEKALIADKEAGWHESDPVAFTTWFRDKVKLQGEQLRRLVHYYKAWADYKSGSVKMPSGIMLTILAVNNFESSADDDGTFVGTCRKMLNQLELDFHISSPIYPYDNLVDIWSETRKNNFLNKLKGALNKGDEALKEEDKEKTSEKWRELFGERFPKYTPPESSKKDSAFRTSAPAILGSDAKSA